MAVFRKMSHSKSVELCTDSGSKVQLLFDKGHQYVKSDCYPDLGFDGIVGSIRCFESKVLLYHLKKNSICQRHETVSRR